MSLEELVRNTPLNTRVRIGLRAFGRPIRTRGNVNDIKNDYNSFARSDIVAEFVRQERLDLIITNNMIDEVPFEIKIKICDYLGEIPYILSNDERIYNYYFNNGNYKMAMVSPLARKDEAQFKIIKNYIRGLLIKGEIDLDKLEGKTIFYIDNIASVLLEDRQFVDLLKMPTMILTDDIVKDNIQEFRSIINGTAVISEYNVILNSVTFISICLEKGLYDYLNSFSGTLSNEMIDTYWEGIINYFSVLPNCMQESAYFLEKVIDSKRENKITLFKNTAFSDEIMEKHGETVLEAFGGDYSLLGVNAWVLNKLFENDEIEKAAGFPYYMFTNKIVDKYWDKIIANSQMFSYIFYNNKYIFEKVLAEGRGELLHLFSNELFTNEIIDRYWSLFVSVEKIPSFLLNNRYFFDTVTKNDRFDLIIIFNENLITEEFIDNNIDKLINVMGKEVPFKWRRNYNLFGALLEKKEYKLALNFDKSFFTEEIIDTYGDGVVDNLESSYGFENNRYLFDKALERGRYELAFRFNSDFFDKDTIDKYGNNNIKDLESNNRNVTCFRKNNWLFSKVLQEQKFDLLYLFDDSLVTKEVIDTYGEMILDNNANEVPGTLSENIHYFNFLLSKNRYDLIKLFPSEFFTFEIVKKFFPELIRGMDSLPYHLNDNIFLFDECLKNGEYKLALDFSYHFFTEDVISRHKKGFLEAIGDRLPYVLDNNEYFMKAVIEAGRFELLGQFRENLLSDEIIDKYINELLERINKYSCGLFSNKKVLYRVLEDKNFALVLSFKSNIVTDDILEKYAEEIVSWASHIPYDFKKNVILFKKAIEIDKPALVLDFDSSLFNSELVGEYNDTLIKYLEENMKHFSYWSSEHRKNKYVFDLLLANGKFDVALQFDDSLLTDDIVRKYGNEFIKCLENDYCWSLKDNKYLYEKALESHNFKALIHFDANLFADDVIDKYFGEIYEALGGRLSYTLIRCRRLFDLLLEEKKYDFIDCFNESFYTEEVVNKHGIKILDSMGNYSSLYTKNIYLFRVALENGMFDKVLKFNEKFFTKDIIEKYKDKFIELSENKVPRCLFSNRYFFNEILLAKKFKQLVQFNENLMTEEIVNEYLEQIIEAFDGTVTYSMTKSSILFNKLLEKGDYKLLIQFDSSFFTKRVIENHIEELLKIMNGKIPDNLDDNEYLFNEFIKRGMDLKQFSIMLFTDNKLVEYYDYFVQAFKADEDLFFKCVDYYPNFLNLLYKNNERELFLSFKFPKDILNNEYWLTKYIEMIGIDRNRLLEKLNVLLTKNDEILNSLTPLFLNERFDKLGIANIEKFGIYRDLQLKIARMDDKFLNIFTKMLKFLNKSDIDLCPVIYKIIVNYKNYKNVINSIDETTINEEQIKNLIYILQRKDNIYNINSVDELTNNEFNRIQDSLFSQISNDIWHGNADIERLRAVLLEKKYCLSLEMAKFICDRYCNPIEALDKQISFYNVLKDIYEIVNTDNIEELEFYFINSKTAKDDFYSIISLESAIRKEYAKMYSDSLYKVKEKDKVDENHSLKKSNPEVYDALMSAQYNGVHPEFYIMSDDFRLQTHALGAYRYWIKPDNFKDDWERPKIAYHGICTAYIANNLIATARPSHPIYGFDSYEGSALLCAGNYDLLSDGVIAKFATGIECPYNMYSPNIMVDRTRHSHNEMVMERRNNKNGQSFKRMPSYVVLVVDDINNLDNFSANNAMFQESIQAAVDNNIPIVIVDRLYFAKREEKRCNELKERFFNDLNSETLKKLITNYMNNIIGCIKYPEVEEAEYHTIFTVEKLSYLMKEIIDEIIRVDNYELAVNLDAIIENETINDESLRKHLKGIDQKLTDYIHSKNATYVSKEDNKKLETIKMSKILKYYHGTSEKEREKITKDIENLVSLDEIIEKIENGLYRSKGLSD